MTVDLNALWFLLVGAAMIGAVGVLMKRLDTIETSLESHGRKLVRIETKLGIPDNNHE
jgi:hypothetical protein